jgi:adenylate cyclase
MDRIWQWAWDRYGARYSWAIYTVSVSELLPVYLVFSFLIVAFERSDRYVEAAAVTVGTVLVMVYVTNLPGLGGSRLVERWAAGREVDRARALDATYAWARTAGARGVGANAVFIALLFVLVGAIAGATGSPLVQYAILGAASGISVVLIAVHSYPEAALRPARVALAGDTGMGDTLPRSRPTFAAWSNLTVLAAAFAFAVAGAMLAVAIDRVREAPVLVVVIGCGLVLFFAVPITVGASFSPSLQPLRDLAEGTERVASGDYSQRLPVF